MMVPDKQALHLADFVFERMQPCASHRVPVFDRQPPAAKGFRIPTRESGQLVIEMLERQIDSQFVRVLLKESAGLLEILGSFRLNQFHHDNHLSLKPAVKRLRSIPVDLAPMTDFPQVESSGSSCRWTEPFRNPIARPIPGCRRWEIASRWREGLATNNAHLGDRPS